MMSPTVYLREIERCEDEITSHCTAKKRIRLGVREHCSYSRKELPCGCILLQMVSFSVSPLDEVSLARVSMEEFMKTNGSNRP
jgi:hypothetical protein